ncbi:histidine--tRNA ligase [Candidatus Poribacteria bacterium]|nr:histidine--tRNA ligase [Candidatus Poribacteria bacterium]
MQIQSPKGTRDILPSEVQTWQWVEQTARDVFGTYGYQEIRTPIFESTDLFVRGVGDTTDIVEKEMYTFSDRGNRSVSLRPEGTASVVRAMLQNRLMDGASVLKFYYIGQMFRYDRPQAGRYREFWQVGIEAFGADSPAIDAEIIAAGHQFFSTLGIKDLTLHLNSIGDPICRPKYVEDLTAYAKQHLNELCGKCYARHERNPMRILDCKESGCRAVIANAPLLSDYLCGACREHFDMVKSHLDELEIDYHEDPYVVRGLDYYCRTAFEFTAGGLGAQNAIGGGGRYDYLAEEIGGVATPGIGFALGMDRIIIALEAQDVTVPTAAPVDVYLTVLGDAAMPITLKLAQELRENGVKTDLEFKGRGLRAQMKTANKLNAQYVVMIGEDEINNAAATVRDMGSGDQQSVAFQQLAEVMREKIDS